MIYTSSYAIYISIIISIAFSILINVKNAPLFESIIIYFFYFVFLMFI